MRNLDLMHSMKVGPTPVLAGAQAMCVDLNTKTVFCATDVGIYGLDSATQQVTVDVSLVEAGYLPPGGGVTVVGVDYLSDQMSVCLATSAGDLVLWNTVSGELECVGSVEYGLTAMSWSSDQELVILATGQNTLIMMTREFDPISEVPMFSDQFGAAEFVNVGWGKKETQFHGMEGKEAASRKAETVQPASDWDNGRHRICWHGDGQYFVVSAIHPQTGSRRLCVWTRDGVLFSTSEQVSGVEQALGWKSNGNLITTSQRKPNKHDIIFYEKNGLRHGEFTLPFGVQDVKVREILWNSESTVLVVWLEDLPKEGESSLPNSYIQLWTVNNYHWYQKQSLRFQAESPVATVTWDMENPLRLHVVCGGGIYLQYTWAWATHRSHGNTATDLTNVAVIDGVRVLMTPFRQAVVPPPLAAYQLELSAPVNQVAFAPPTAPNDLALLMDNNTVAMFTFEKEGDTTKPSESVQIKACGGNGLNVKCPTPQLQAIYSLEADEAHPCKFYHMTWIDTDQLLLCCGSSSGSVSQLVRVQLDREEGKCKVLSTVDLEGFLYNIAVSSETGHIALQLTDGMVLKYDPASDSVLPWVTDSGEELSYNAWKLCTQMDVTTIGGEEVLVGLTDRYQLYVNNAEVATNCTSYAIHDEFLLLTTYAHTCRCICRKTAVKVLPSLSDGKSHPFDESIRRVERGSRIVAVVPMDTTLVLQMPRGNLETIHPRALVLSTVRKHLDRLQFKDAFTLMRKHRINMNLIFDHSPSNFLENIDLFVLQVAAPSLVNQFLTDLQEEDVTKTMYTAAYNQEGVTLADNSKVKDNKIDKICDCVRLALQRIDSDKYLLSILTAYVRKSSPELDTALKVIKELKGRVHSSNVISPEEALKYLLFLTDVNELYDVALGTYDFDLVLLVAEKSQKDPKEYIPFLNSLRQMEENYRHYTIDNHLKHYKTALTNIVKCGDTYFNECLTLIKEQRLYREGLALYPVNSTQYKEIAVEYAQFLLEKKHSEEAGVILSKAEQWQSALEAFEQCSNWRMAVCMAYKAGYHDNNMEELCKRLAESLREQNRHSDAASIYEQHLNDVEEAIVTLVEGSQWEESLRLMHKYRRTDFIETHLSAALVENQANYLSLLSGVYEEFEKYKTRLGVVRAQKEKARLEFLEGGEPNTADADLYSDTSSATGESAVSGRSGSQVSADSQRSSVFSKKSGRSAKTRRKQERKKWSLKEGSQYEDIALIEALAKTVRQAEDWKGDISSLLRMLMMFHYQREAESLQQKFDTLLTLLDVSIPEIWPEDTTEQGTSLPTLGPHSTANAIAQAVQQGKVPTSVSEVKINPSLRIAPVLTKDNKWKLHCSETSNR